MSARSVPSLPSLVLADLIPATRLRQLGLVGGYAGAIALASQLAVPLPFSPVPLTLQTLVVLCGAAALGPVRATAGAGLYLALGVAGVPWFAVSGGATAGYLVGFVVAAALVGRGARAGADRSVFGAVRLMAVGNLVIWSLGATGLVLVTGIGLSEAIAVGVVPFLVGDFAKLAIAAAFLPSVWRLVDETDQA